ncbi:hypothetical protein BMB171_C0849 [Bacillus thuringiensis BMB171]|nr:hypothetical protein BMB171_C0849 [Bacillus thuringiensis BMB171]
MLCLFCNIWCFMHVGGFIEEIINIVFISYILSTDYRMF